MSRSFDDGTTVSTANNTFVGSHMFELPSFISGGGAYQVDTVDLGAYALGDDENDTDLSDGSAGDGVELFGVGEQVSYENVATGADGNGVYVGQVSGFPVFYSFTESKFFVITDHAGVGGSMGLSSGGPYNYPSPVTYTGTGNDNVFYGTAWNDFAQGFAGRDAFYGGNGSDELSGGLGHDTLIGDGGFDSLFGENGNDKLYGSYGDDLLDGGAGLDTLYGGEDQDVLKGGAGNDKLFGGFGNDTLLGGAGADTLAGGAGTDVFQFLFVLGDAADVITDFSGADGDTIQISRSLTNLGNDGPLSSERFTVGAAASEANDRFIYDFSTGNFYYDADGSGAGAQVHFATLANPEKFYWGDIVLV